MILNKLILIFTTILNQNDEKAIYYFIAVELLRPGNVAPETGQNNEKNRVFAIFSKRKVW